MGPANGFRAALLQEHRMSGVTVSFLEKRDIKKMTAGAGSEGIKTDKGVLDEKMGNEFMDFMEYSDDDDVSAACSCCVGGVPEHLRKQLVLSFETMKEATLRPGNLKDLMFGDLLSWAGRYVVNVRNPKVKGQNKIWAGDDMLRIFKEAREKTGKDYVFPRCIVKHLEAALRAAEMTYDWPEGLVFTPHCLRHTCISGKVRKMREALTVMETGITGSTTKMYARENANRNVKGKREREESGA